MDYWDISSEVYMMAVCLIPLDHYHYSITAHSQAILHVNSKVQAQSQKESMWYAFMQQPLKCSHAHALCQHPSCIHHAGHYQLEMVFVHGCLPQLQLVTHCIDLTAFSCFCSIIKRHTYVSNNHLISETCTVILTLAKFLC